MAQTGSFIPKQPKARSSRGGGIRKIYVFSYVSYVLFFGTLLAVIGLFLFQVQLERSLANLKSDLAIERDSFSQSDIERVREFEQRIVVATELLNEHVAPSQIFAALEQNTVRPVELSEFSFERNGQLFDMNVSGVARSFNDLLFQREVLGNVGLLSGAEIVDISFGVTEDDEVIEIQDRSDVRFVVSKSFDREEISYEAPGQALVPASTGADEAFFEDTSVAEPDFVTDSEEEIQFEDPTLFDEGTVTPTEVVEPVDVPEETSEITQ